MTTQEVKTDLQAKLQSVINSACKYADKRGSTTLSTCNMSGWDNDIWNYQSQIIKAIRNRGYNVSVSVNWGVTDIVTSVQVELS